MAVVTKRIGRSRLSQSIIRRKKSQDFGPLAKRRERWFYLMISPWIIGFILFQAGPILATGVISLSKFNLKTGLTFTGLSNYALMFNDPLLGKTLLNTFYYTAVSVPLGLVVAFVLAFLLNQKIHGVTIFRTFFFLPSIVQGVAVTILWGWIFNPKFGLINTLLSALGMKGPGWLQSEQWAMPAVILMSLWGIGWMMLVYLAGLQDIPVELYEASELDGASGLQKLRYITIPMISPVTFFLLITSMISSMQIFVPTYVLTRGGPNNATMTISLLVYFNAFFWDKMGYASAIGVLLFFIILLFTILQFTLGKRWVHYGTEVS